MLNNYNIIINKYRWASDLPVKDVNFFSDEAKTLVDSIDCKEYLMDISDLNITFDNAFAGDNNSNNQIFFECSDINMTLSGTRNNKYLKTFFGLFQDTEYDKWELKISNLAGNTLIYRGVIYQENIKEGFKTGDDNEQIKVTALGFEKEFKAYYSEETLKGNQDITWNYNEAIDRKYKSISGILNDNFPNVEFQLEEGLSDYNVVEVGVLKGDANTGSGIKSIGQLSSNRNERIAWSSHGGEEEASATAKTDFIITESELSSSGFIAGDELTSMTVKFHSNNAQHGTRYHGFSIRMGLSTASSLSNFYSGSLSTCVTQQVDLYNSEINGGADFDIKFNFTTTFTWDGVSNIVVRMCYDYAETFDEASNIINVYTYACGALQTFNLIKSDVGSLGGCGLTTGDTQDILQKPYLKISYIRNYTPRDIFIKSGYERFWASGMSRYDWFSTLCASMGWVFYYWNDKFFVKNRSSDLLDTKALDYQKIIDLEVSKDSGFNTFKHVLILDGVIWGTDESGGGQSRGARFNMITANDTTPNQTWWTRLNGTLLNEHDIGWRFMMYWNEDDSAWRYAIREWDAPNHYGQNIIAVSKEQMVRVNAGDSKAFWTGYRAEDGTYFLFTEGESNEISGNEIRFKGCTGSMLFKLVRDSVSETYLDYVKTDLFRNNFLKFYYQKTSRKMDVTYKEAILNPLVIYSIVNNTSGNNLDGVWIGNSMSINLNENTTKINLQLKQ